MIYSKKALLMALALPILGLTLLIGFKKYTLSFGTEYTFPISGYDPRDLLSGHYLTFTVDYGVNDLCDGDIKSSMKGYVCLEPKDFSYYRPHRCTDFIIGRCRGRRFNSGIERFYIPEKEAKRLEELVQNKKASIVVSVSKGGKAQIKDLLIDGVSWKSND